MKFEKLCPCCGDPIYYSTKSNLTSSIKQNRYCYTCGARHKRKVVFTDEMRTQRSERVKGEKNPCYNRTGSLSPMFGLTGSLSPTYGSTPWNKGIENPFLPETLQKMKLAKKSIGKWKGENNPNFGNHQPLSNEHRRKVRLSHIRRVEQLKLNGYSMKPNFNVQACQIIDDYGRTHGFCFQHAMNGGEFFIQHLGYWVDGYDKQTNTVIEYYEDNHHHYNKDGSLKNRDLMRIEEIRKHLGCKVIILEEKHQPNFNQPHHDYNSQVSSS